MPRKTKDHLPRNMEDLEKIFYGPDKDGKKVNLFRLRRYLDNLKTQVLSPSFEGDVKKMFAPLGKTEKIPENQEHTNFDYKIDAQRLLLEVTSLNINETSPRNLTRMDVLRKLEVAIEHILAKDASPFPKYRRGGVIVYTLIFNFFSKFHKLLNDKLPEISGMLNNDLDFLVFFPEPASINNKDSWKVFPIVFYVKDPFLAREFMKVLHRQNCKIFLS
jgi:hypothetical protein